MSGLVQLFWLQRTDHRCKKLKVQDKRDNQHCPGTNLDHFVELVVPEHVSFDHVQDRGADGLYLVYDQTETRLECKCGHVFGKQNGDYWFSTGSYLYTNPRTGKTGDMAHVTATPGAMWECPWLVDGRDEADIRAGMSGILSRFYVEQWYGKRNPIQVMCPDRSCWIIDQKASNGEGWTVTGSWQDPITLTAMPSIVCPGYHGWVTNGWFTEDCEGRVFDKEKMNEARS